MQDRTVDEVLAHYPGLGSVTVEPFGSGLINQTYKVTGADGSVFVLQEVNKIFDPRIHDNIALVTRRLSRAGLVTPRLLETRGGSKWVEIGDEPRVFRLMTYIDGVSFDVAQSLEQVWSAGRLIGRFHLALDGFEEQIRVLRLGVHDTAAHLARLEEAVEIGREHRLYGEVVELATAIGRGVEDLPPLPKMPRRVCHGDLKLNNILFEGAEPPERDRALALIDLDTIAPMELAYELGDAWRSWCNTAGEDQSSGRFDLDIFTASLEGYAEGLGRRLSDDEVRALLHGVEWVSLELAARFAADAIFECYFGYDHSRFDRPGEHNLLRARGQWSLHQAILATRREREAALFRLRG